MSANITRLALQQLRGLRIVEINTLADAASRELDGLEVTATSMTDSQLAKLPAGRLRTAAMQGALDARLACARLWNLRRAGR